MIDRKSVVYKLVIGIITVLLLLLNTYSNLAYAFTNGQSATLVIGQSQRTR